MRISMFIRWLEDGTFLCITIWLIFLAYVAILRYTYFSNTALTKEERWSLSAPNECSQKWEVDWLKTWGPYCSKTELWILPNRFLSVDIPIPCLTTLHVNITSVAFTIFRTLAHGNTNHLVVWKLWTWYTQDTYYTCMYDNPLDQGAAHLHKWCTVLWQVKI